MTISQAITKELVSAIIQKCGVTESRALAEIKAAKSASKATGLPLADTLVMLGLV